MSRTCVSIYRVILKHNCPSADRYSSWELHIHSRASISQDYWGDIKEDWRSGGQKSPRSLSFFCETTHRLIFALKYYKQLLLLLDKINLAAHYTFKNIFFSLSTFQALKYNKYVIHFPWGSGYSFFVVTRVDILNDITSKILGEHYHGPWWTSPS